jgi:N-methylhydantoinase B
VIDNFTSDLIRSSLVYASEEMGIALRNASYSPNIKERMDHSAAIFDPEGRLLAQAEHIPVHLGSLPWGLKNVLEYASSEGMALEDGSMIAVNNPYIAGTHLNDITIVRPVYHSGKLLGFVANKAHHSDVGGKVPGSISVDARSLYEEGLVLNPTYIMRRNEIQNQVISMIVSNSRTPVERAGDLKAQIAANYVGEKRMLEVIEKYGIGNFSESSSISFSYAERIMKSRLAQLKPGEYSAEDYLEDPAGKDVVLKLTLKTFDDSALEFDYTGTASEVESPINSVFGVTVSGAQYVVRTLFGDDIPANHGAFAALKIFAPEGTVINPTFPHPVAIGNLETSQRNADLLYRTLSKALPHKVPAASGGSMNNIMMGGINVGKSWAFYETIGVGLGARPKTDGLDGIQCNMTNTMNTPIEDIERSLPVIMRKYEFRPDSSGAGEFRGGDGIVRSFQMTGEATTVTVVSDRQKHAPWGLQGGHEAAGVEIILYKKKSRTRKNLPCKSTNILEQGDVIELRTAGGGGFGSAGLRDPAAIEDDLKDGLLSNSYVKKNYWKHGKGQKKK